MSRTETEPKPSSNHHHTAQIIELAEGWAIIYAHGIQKLQNLLRLDEASRGKDAGTLFTNEEYAKLYTTIYQMCIQKHPYCYTAQLYDKHEESIVYYLRETALPAIQAQRGPFMLKELVRRWEDHRIMSKWMRDFFQYLNRFYVKRHSKKPLEEVCLTSFRVHIFDVIQPHATPAILQLIEQDRNDETVDRELLQQVIQIYVEMGMGGNQVYVERFEVPFLAATTVYYSRESDNWLQSDSCPQYLLKAEKRIEQELRRLTDFLHHSTETKLKETLYRALLLRHQTELLDKENTGLRVMLQNHALTDLSRLFQLFSAVATYCPSPASSPLDPIAKMVYEHISRVGADLISQVTAQNSAEEKDKYVVNLITVHDKYYDMVQGCFKANATFHKALKDAFENIVNKNICETTTAELLSNHADSILQKGSGVRLSEQELQDTLDKVVRLFTYLTDKDMFNEFYRKQLAKRLLLQRSASIDAEKSMIGKLKLRCGTQFTSKLEGMINDMRAAEDHANGFKDFVRDNALSLPVDFSVQVLTSGFWPTYTPDEVTLAPIFSRCLDVFKQYYGARTSNRRLHWIHHLGVVTVAGNFEKSKKRIDLVVSTMQASLLLPFNEAEELSIENLIRITGMTPEDVKKYLRSLVSGKTKILLKKPAEGYAVNHLIRVNSAFTHQQRRVRIPHIPSKASAKERESSLSAVTEDRKHAIEANIVRVMKARKTLNHQNLVTEVSQQLMSLFRPDPRTIKKRIEDLIAREYLERDANDHNIYHYLA